VLRELDFSLVPSAPLFVLAEKPGVAFKWTLVVGRHRAKNIGNVTTIVRDEKFVENVALGKFQYPQFDFYYPPHVLCIGVQVVPGWLGPECGHGLGC